MIITEIFSIGEKNFIKYYSDKKVYILQKETGNKYSEAIDLEGIIYTYIEIDEPIPKNKEEENEKEIP